MTALGIVTATVEGHDLLHHLLVDLLMKGAIVVLALITLAVGMVVIWRKFGRTNRDGVR